MPALYMDLFNPLNNSMRQVLLLSFNKQEMRPRESEKLASHPANELGSIYRETMYVKCLAYSGNYIPQKVATIIILRKGVCVVGGGGAGTESCTT